MEEQVRIDRHELVNRIRAYGRVSRAFGYGRATDVEVDAAFVAVLDMIYPPLSWEEPKDAPAVSGIERASRQLDDMSVGAELNYRSMMLGG